MRWFATAYVLAAAVGLGAAGYDDGSESNLLRDPTVVAVVPEPVSAVAQDDGRVALMTTNRSRCAVFILTLATRRRADISGVCTGYYPSHRLALAGKRVLWTFLYRRGNTECHISVINGGIGQRPRTVYDAYQDSVNTDPGHVECSGSFPIYGDGATLVFGTSRVTAGGIARIPGVNRVFAVAGRRLTIGRGVKMAVVDAVTGKEIASLPVDQGTVLSVAMSPSVVAFLTTHTQAPWSRIELFDATSGVRGRSVAVPNDVAHYTGNDISAAGTSVVFHTGRTIRLLDAKTGILSVLARARATPIGLSIEGRRVLWAETRNGRGILRMVVLPR